MAAFSSSSGGRCKYDVFLSFRGEDTRKIFVGHLYRALQHKAINAFIDSEELAKGDRILKLLEAIEASRLSIVVLSQNYASSTWCLKELVRIVECMDDKKQVVVPVFYEVDPSHIRKIEGSFAQAFAKHGDNPKIVKEELESWRSAFTRVADLSGWDSRKYEDDGKLVEEIVENTFRTLRRTSSSKANGLVGMDLHITQMMSRLCLWENDVRVVGIWGMGGLGKTTIARAVFDKIAWRFDHSCFLDNVKEAFKSKRQIEVQEKLISILLEEKVQSLGLNRGWNMIKEKLGMKKVLVVLDDVETNLQIEDLLGDAHAFGEGSRVIVTTRDKQSLSAADETYKPKCLRDDEARDLFMKNAFKTNQPNGDFHHLSSRAIEYAQGLPLALTVLGAFLRDKSVCEWEGVLKKLKKIPHIGIQDVLRTSFDGLDDSEKAIFLDIACVFREWDIDLVTEILDSCGFSPVSGIRVLCDRALITVSFFKTIYMHDLIQDMGREIVRQESIEKAGNRSRLWSYQDVSDALTRNTVTDAVECLILDLGKSEVDFCIHSEAFVRMTKLRLLIICYSFHHLFVDRGGDYGNDVVLDFDDCLQFLKGDLEFLSHEMRFLLWHGCPLKSLPATFIPYNLVILDMRSSNLRQLWEGIKPLPKLKIIMLNHCKYLVKIPDLTGAINLEKLFLDGCSSLSEGYTSVFALQNLQVLNLRGCIHLSSLEYLNLNGCSNLEKFPKISGIMNELTELRLDETAIKRLPLSINLLLGVKTLTMRNCKNLEFLYDSTCNFGELAHLDLSGCSKLQTISASIHLSSLKHLNLDRCSNLEKFPEISGIMEELTDLRLDGTAIKEVPSSIDMLMGIKMLSMMNCKSLEFLPDSICNLSKLEKLDLSGCSELKTLPTSIHWSSLKYLYLDDCSKLEKFPEISGIMKKLTELRLDGTTIKEVPSSINLCLGIEMLSMRNCKSLEKLDSICNFSKLEKLYLNGCSELKTLPTNIHWSALMYLYLDGCSKLEKFPEIFGIMEKLTELHLDGTAIKEVPSSINLCLGIERLSMRSCKSLEFLLDNICNLPNLWKLDLSGCSELKTLSTSIYRNSLMYLYLDGCSKLEKFPEISGIMEELIELPLEGTAIKEVPSSIDLFIGIKTLSMRNCKSLEFLPDNICNLPELWELDLSGCSELKTLPTSIHWSSLRYLYLDGCSKLEKFPEISGIMEELIELHLDGTAIKEVPSSIDLLLGIETLSMRNCKSLEFFSNNICNLPELSMLDLSGCSELKTLPTSIHWSSLRYLYLDGCSKLEKFPEISGIMKELTILHLEETAIKEVPSSIDLLLGIEMLSMRNCKSLEFLLDSICILPELWELNVSGCSDLKTLPTSIHWSFLRYLNLDGCLNLDKFPEISGIMKELT